MVVFVQAVDLDAKSKEEDEPETIFIHVEAKKDTIEDVLEDGKDVDLEVKITDGIESFRAILNREKIIKGKGDDKNQDDEEWYTLFLQALFQSIPVKSNDSIEFIAKKLSDDNNESSIELEIKTKIGGSINKTMGTVKIDQFDPGEDFSYADCLFQWCKIISDTSRDRQQARMAEQVKNKELTEQIEENAKFQKQLVEDSKKRYTYTVKVLTRLLNEKKEHYQQLLSGEVHEEDDDFNIIAIKTIKDDLAKEEELANKPKAKRYKKNPQTSKPVKKLNLRKMNAKQEDEDDDGDEFMSGSGNEEHDSTKVKKEKDAEKDTEVNKEDKNDSSTDIKKEETPEIPKASKAKSEKSMHFKFKGDEEEKKDANESNDNEDDKKQGKRKQSDDTDTEEDATEDDDDDKDVEMNDDTEEDNGTVTDTDSGEE